MVTLSIRNLPEIIRDRLRVAAAERGRSMEAEVRALLIERYGGDKEPEFDLDAMTEDVQQAFAPYRTKEGSIVDELLAERRVEAWTETLETLHDLNRNGKPGKSGATGGADSPR